MCSDPVQHRVAPGETLDVIARTHALPGWQSLYFSRANRSLRSGCPNPWNPPIGAVLAIPSDRMELRATLERRLGWLDRLRREARALLWLQTKRLRDTVNAHHRQDLTHLIMSTVETTLDAIELIEDAEMSSHHAARALVRDAAERRPPIDTVRRAELLTLLARAAEGVIWAIPEPRARSWCDAGSPSFWAAGLRFGPTPSCTSRHGEDLALSCQLAGEAVLLALDSLYCGALDEAGQLARSEPSHSAMDQTA